MKHYVTNCRANPTAYRKLRRENLIKAGICLHCKEPALKDSVYCGMHYEVQKERERVYKRKVRLNILTEKIRKITNEAN